ncbi:MAG: sulfatase [Planctomycetales bacterium 71-10]|nr:MAG: sulfatase [Planctomycetales bacterium 71-10]
MERFRELPDDPRLLGTRRHFFGRASLGIGGAALASLLGGAADPSPTSPDAARGSLGGTHFAPKAKRVIYLFMSGGPSQLDLFDYKPLLNQMNGKDLPDSVRQGQRLTGMSANQAALPLAGSIFSFARHGQSGAWVSDLLPHTAKVADELCFIRSLHTEAINHDPAITFFQTGSQIAGRPSIGAWLSYGLGSMNENLPTFCVLISKRPVDQPLYSRLWGNGFLPSIHQGVQFRAGAEPVLYLDNPPGVTAAGRRKMLDRLAELHRKEHDANLDPAVSARIAQYEMAYRMQTSVPEAAGLASEPDHIYELYGPDARNPGSFAANCLLARRLAERGVRFIQLYHPGWDHHGGLPGGIRQLTKETDQGCAALIQDLKQRGMLDDTLVLWGGEFGRTNYSQGKLSPTDYGRDHHPRCFTAWAAGGGVKPGVTFGETDEFGYNVVADPVHVHDFHATILHLLGVDHERLTYKFQGRYFRLTDVAGEVVKPILRA